jgi:glutamate--cysteine ligase
VTFRRFLGEGIEGWRPTMDEWDLHLSTLFPEVRLKNYLEVRGADAGPLPMVLALPALWRGLLYDEDACAAATELTARLSFAERLALREAVPAAGLATAVPGGGTVRDLAVELVDIALKGLGRQGEDVTKIEPLVEIAETGRAPADHVRDAFQAAAGDRSRFVAALEL